jgi:hypothetical protein
VRVIGGKLKAWIIVDYESPQDSQGGKYLSTKQLDYYDCKGRTVGTGQIVYYSMNLGQGDSVHSAMVPPEYVSYSDVVPDTVGEKMLNTICLKLPKQKK